jgi:MSHA biogenesis protein MshI
VTKAKKEVSLNWLRRKRQKKPGVLGLAFSEQGLAMVWVDPSAETQKLKHWELLVESPSQIGALLADRVAQLELEHMPCSVVLAADRYELQLVEAPNVPVSERLAAVRFLLKDKVKIPLDDLNIDVFTVPEDAYPRPMLYAVGASMQHLIEVRDLVLESGLRLDRIDIREMAVRSLALALTEAEDGLAVLDVRDGQARLSLMRDGTLYLCRSLNTKIDQASMASSDWAFNFERFLVELQRSLDFFENQMGQGQVMQLLLAPVPGVTNQLIEQLNLNLVAQASALNLNELWNTGSLLSARDQHEVLFVAGAVLDGDA